MIIQCHTYTDPIMQVLQCLIHCADLGNPAKPVDLAAEWAKRITQEHFLQGDEEKMLGIPLNPLGDREQVCLGKCQVYVSERE